MRGDNAHPQGRRDLFAYRPLTTCTTNARPVRNAFPGIWQTFNNYHMCIWGRQPGPRYLRRAVADA